MKRQTHRTDLFGFGAVAFDLLTAGKSPERFYDLLRPLDKVREDGRPVQVADIDRAYSGFFNAPSAEPAHRALFNELRVGTAFPSPAFVAMLLKCMLSKPEDSFFGGKSGRSSRECFELLADEVETLVNRANALRYLPDHANPLWRGDRAGTGGTPKPNLGFTTTLKEHRQASKKDKKALILVRGYRLLRQLSETVKDLIIRHTDPDRRLFFTHLGPDHLEEDGSYDEQTVAYLSEEVFLGALRSGEVIGFGNTAERSNFVPPFMRYRTRLIYGEFIADDAKKGSGQPLHYRLHYGDSVSSWSGVQVGDFVRSWVPNDAIKLFRIEHVEGDLVNLQLLREQNDQQNDQQNDEENDEVVRKHGNLKGELIKQIQPSDYYLGVLGIYVHQLFFVGGFPDFAPISPRCGGWRRLRACTV